MSDFIDFPCPACGTKLRLPLEMAAVRGPCPTCGREIIAPDPAEGTEAQEAEALPAAGPAPTLLNPQRTRLVLSCLLTGVAGYLLGTRATPPVATLPAPVNPVIEVVGPAEPVKATAAAEVALRAFLAAPDWAARSAYVLFPREVRGAMEAYSHRGPDGPTRFESLSAKQGHLDPRTGRMLYMFSVVTPNFPAGIPAAVKETAEGWLVDWQAFVEFRDGHFQQFVDGPVHVSGTFHLIVTTPPADTENEHFSTCLLKPPLAGTPQLAFVRKTSEAFKTIQTALEGGEMFTPVLEVVKRKSADGNSFFEVLAVTAIDWLPVDPMAARSEEDATFPEP